MYVCSSLTANDTSRAGMGSEGGQRYGEGGWVAGSMRGRKDEVWERLAMPEDGLGKGMRHNIIHVYEFDYIIRTLVHNSI